MLIISMRTTLHSENAGMNDAFEYRGRCLINSLQVDLRPSDLKFPFSSPSVHHPAYLISLSCSFVVKANHDSESARSIRFLSLSPRSIKYLRLMNYQLSGLHTSRSFHFHLYVQRAELREHRTNCVSNLYRILLYLRTEHGGLHCKHSG
jgi:hypothetical protein